jgi:hypothetical protein
MLDGRSAHADHRKLWRRVRFNFAAFVFVCVCITGLAIVDAGGFSWDYRAWPIWHGLLLIALGTAVFGAAGAVFWAVGLISSFVSREYAEAAVETEMPDTPLMARRPPHAEDT